MPRYKAVSNKKLAERSYPYHVNIKVPGHGLGSRLDQMHAWGRQRGCEWEARGHQIRQPGEIPQDFARFYLMEQADALAFREQWGGEISERV